MGIGRGKGGFPLGVKKAPCKPSRGAIGIRRYLKEESEHEPHENEPHEEGEEHNEFEEQPAKQARPEPDRFPHVFGSKFDSFMFGNVQYSLTRRVVARPRKLLVRMNDYVVANQKLY